MTELQEVLRGQISLREIYKNQEFTKLKRIRFEAVKHGFKSDSQFIGWDEETPYLIDKIGIDEILGINEDLLEQLELFINHLNRSNYGNV